MLEGKDLILATKQFASEDRTKSWLFAATTFIGMFAALSGAFFVHIIYIRLLLSIVSSLFMARMFVIYHDYLHHAILNKSALAKGMFTIVGLFMLAPINIWKRSHDYHHKHNCKLFTASIGSYPILTKKKFESLSSSDQARYLATRHPITIFFGYFSMFLIGMCFKSFINSPKKHIDSLIAIILHFGLYVLLFWYGGWQGCFFALFLPSLITYALGAYLFYAQHNFPGVSFTDNNGWAYEKAALESSSFMVMNPLMRWSLANIGYHHVHHLNSRIPFYRLPEAMAAIPELQHPKRTSLSFKDVRSCFKLKVWDPESDKMVGLG